MLAFSLLLATLWGAIVAIFLEYTSFGRFIEERLTWFIVAVGMGGDLLIALLLIDPDGRVLWWQMVAVIALSSVAVSVRGILEFFVYFRALVGMVSGNGNQDPISE